MAKIRLSNTRISFPVLWTPESVGDDDKPAFSASFLLDPTDPQVAAIEKAIEEAAAEKWPKDHAKILAAIRKADKTCLHDGSVKDYDGFEGKVFVSARNPVRPLVIDSDKSQLAESDGRPYAGCYVNASLEIWAQDNKWGKRVNATLLGVQFYRDGDSFGGARTGSADDFEDVSSAGGVGAEDDDVAGMV